MRRLNGSETHANLSRAFADVSQAHQRYVWFAAQADVDGRPEVAALFRTVASGVAGHAQGHLEFLADVGDPATGEPIGDTDDNLRVAIATEREESSQRYPDFAATARAEGFDAVADWFDTLAAADADHVADFAAHLDGA